MERKVSGVGVSMRKGNDFELVGLEDFFVKFFKVITGQSEAGFLRRRADVVVDRDYLAIVALDGLELVAGFTGSTVLTAH